MRITSVIILLTFFLMPLPIVSGGLSSTEFYLHQGTCSGYSTPCLVMNENNALASSPAGYTMNRIKPVLYVGLMPAVQPTGLNLNGGNYTLHMYVAAFTIDPAIDPAYLTISLVRNSRMLANQTFFNPTFGENRFALRNIMASTGTPTLYLMLNLTGSSVTSLTINYDYQNTTSRLTTAGFAYLGVPSLTPLYILQLTILVCLLSRRMRKGKSVTTSS